jgi:hypothetical protein
MKLMDVDSGRDGFGKDGRLCDGGNGNHHKQDHALETKPPIAASHLLSSPSMR